MNSTHSQHRAYSFDVFDNVVTRMVAHPRDLFFILGIELAPAELSKKAKRRFAATFQRARIRAEKRARRVARPRQDTTIDAIYSHFHIRNGLPLSVAELVAREIALERENLYAVPRMAARIHELRKAGQRIIFISDMYLPAAVLGRILKDLGVMADGDGLYVSADMGLTKHSGDLYRHVLQVEHLDPHQLVHTGDNIHSDVARPRFLGIEARHFTEAQLSTYEAAMVHGRVPHDPAQSFLAAFSRRIRLTAPPPSPELRELMGIACATIIPFLLAYVQWVLGHAKQHGIKRLFFVARDGEVMLRIAEVLEHGRDDVDIRYLYGSRRAWLHSTLRNQTRNWRATILFGMSCVTRAEIASKLAIPESTQATLCTELHCSLNHWRHQQLTMTEAHAFLDMLVQSTSMTSATQRLLVEANAAAAVYARQEGLLDNNDWALVDDGWTLNSQAALWGLLREADPDAPPPTGYYIDLSREHLSPTEAGVAYTFLTPPSSIISRRADIVEALFTPSTHATTIGYKVGNNNIVMPIFGNEYRSEFERSYASTFHQAAIAAARLLTNPRYMKCMHENVNLILHNAIRFIAHPDINSARSAEAFHATQDLRHHKKHVRPLCKPLTIRSVATMMARTTRRNPRANNTKPPWIEADIKISPLYLRLPLFLIANMASVVHDWRRRKSYRS